MSDHNFEKQVRGQMDEFRIRPSDRIWEALEQKLDQEKKPRKFYPWLFLAALVLLGIGYGSYNYFFVAEKPAQTALVVTQPEKDDSGQTTKAADIRKADGSVKNKTTEISSADSRSSENILEKKSGELFEVSSSKKNVRQTTTEDNISKSRELITTNTRSESLPATRKSSPGLFPKAEVLPEDSTGIENAASNASILTEELQVPRNAIVARLNRPSTGEVAAKNFKGHNFSSLNSIKKTLVSKWSWGLNLYYGRSVIGSGNFLNMNKAEVADLAYATPPSAMLPSPSITYQPAALQDGPSYTIGAYLRRELTSKIAISAEINYSRLSSQTNLGERINRSQIINSGNFGTLNVSYYYRPEQEQSYKMNYDFIELPVAAHYKFNELAKVPLELNAGISLARMLSTNALHFDGTTGFYYENDQYFNRWQTTFDLGVSARLFKDTKIPILIGPKLRYMFSSLHDKEISQKNRFLNIGVEAKISLGRFR